MVHLQPDPRAAHRRAPAAYPAPVYADPHGQQPYPPGGSTAPVGNDDPVAPVDPPAAPARAARRRLGRRYLRRQTAPHYTIGLLALSASAARAAIALTGAEAEIATTTAIAAFIAAVVVSAVALRRAPTSRERRWAIVCAGAAGIWVSSVAANGLSWDATGVLVALGTVLALPWWRRHRLPNDPGVEPIADGLDPYPALWGAHCGGSSGGPLGGSWLTGCEEIKAGVRYILQLVPGKQSLQTALSALPNLRTGVRLLPGQDLIVEKHPLLDESCLRLTVVTRSPVQKPIGWPGPSAYNPRTGTLALGPFVDGEGVGQWRVCTENSLWGGFLCGSTGSGKSRMFESLALTLAANGFVVWFGDKQGGASSPLLAKHADYTARSVADIGRMLDIALLVMQLREAENTLNELDGFTHSPARPGLFIFIDECQAPFADATIQAKATTIAREGRKLGVAIIAASQTGTLDAFGKGPATDTLRSSLMMGNLVVLRCASNNPKNVFGLDIDPKAFPDLPGYGLLVDRSGNGRSAPLRGYDPGDQETRSAVASRITWRGLDRGAAGAAGPMYRDRRIREQAQRAALAAKVAALRAGHMVSMTTPDTLAAPQPVPSHLTVIQFPTWPMTPGTTPSTALASNAPAPAGAGRSKLTRSHHTVLQAVGEGRTTNAMIRSASGWSETHVRNLLNELCDWGYLTRRTDQYGHYDITGQPSEVPDDRAAMA